MPQIKYTEQIRNDFERLSTFLEINAPEKVSEAMETIFDKFDLLLTFPEMGSPVASKKINNLRKLFIPYGQSGYVALYSYDSDDDLITLQSIRHSRELEPDFLRNK